MCTQSQGPDGTSRSLLSLSASQDSGLTQQVMEEEPSGPRRYEAEKNPTTALSGRATTGCIGPFQFKSKLVQIKHSNRPAPQLQRPRVVGGDGSTVPSTRSPDRHGKFSWTH